MTVRIASYLLTIFLLLGFLIQYRQYRRGAVQQSDETNQILREILAELKKRS